MQAVLRHTGVLAAQLGIGVWRTIPGNDLERFPPSHGVIHAVDEIEKRRCHRIDLPATVVAQEVVNLSQRIGEVLAIRPVGAAQGFAGVGVVEGQPPLGDRWNVGKERGVARFGLF